MITTCLWLVCCDHGRGHNDDDEDNLPFRLVFLNDLRVFKVMSD